MRTLLILGAGTAGTLMAHKLRAALPVADWRVLIIDQDDDHVYQPGLLFIPFGMDRAADDRRSRRALMPDGVELNLDGIAALDTDRRTVTTRAGAVVPYDLLIIATGTQVEPGKTEGLTGPGWRETASDFYTLEGSEALRGMLARFRGGRLVVNIAELPIKCPVAPLEFALLADAHLRADGRRAGVEIVYVTPLSGAFTKPVASRLLGELLERRQITVVPDFSLAKVDGERRQIQSWGGATVDYDLLVSVPLHYGAEFLRGHPIANDEGFVHINKHTLEVVGQERVFAIGDATDAPTSKAGAVAHFQGEVLIENVLRAIDGLPALPAFDGHANCFIESGDGKAMLLDFNYETEPLPGRFPLPALGPFTLLEESEVNHWGKRAFRWIYWNLLLRGKELPLDHRMLMAGKRAG